MYYYYHYFCCCCCGRRYSYSIMLLLFPNHRLMASDDAAYNSTVLPLAFSSVLSNTQNLDNRSTAERPSTVSNDTSTALGAIILGIVFLLGVPGNLFIIWSILARARKRSITTLLILNLACADGLLMALTIFFVVYLVKQSWVFGNTMCKVLFYLCNANMYASILLITLMSVYRLVAVVLPQRLSALTGRKTVLRLIAALWLLVPLISVPAVVFREEREDRDEKGTPRLVCAVNHTESGDVSDRGLGIL